MRDPTDGEFSSIVQLTHLSQLGLKILFFALWGGKSSVISRGDSFKMAVV